MNKGVIIVLVSIIVLYLSLVFVFNYGSDEPKDQYQVELEKLDKAREDLEGKNKEIERKIKKLDVAYDSLGLSLKEVIEVETQLKEERDEKIDRVDGMDNDDLYRFFAGFKTDGLRD